MSTFTWGLIGPGRIAHRFAQAVHHLPGTRLHAVHGRDPGRAAAFAAQWSRDGVPPVQVAATLDALLGDPAVDAVYIATPHSHHGEAIRACLLAGKPVLCEKPLVPSRALAEPLVALARQRGVFLMEAVWTRFLPAVDQLQAWLRQGRIGALRGLRSTIGFHAPFDPASRWYDPALAGGALLDIGLYSVVATRLVLQAAWGHCPAPTRLHADAVIAPTGVDQRVSASLVFDGDGHGHGFGFGFGFDRGGPAGAAARPDGLVSQFVCGIDAPAHNGLLVHGEHGHIHLPGPFWQATEARLHRPGAAVAVATTPHRINGFEGEVEEVVRCVRAGLVESPRCPLDESLAALGWLDALRRSVGVRYPFERADD